ncbi:hypothetical protein LAY57_25550 [Argonema antarcticum A004/B2]|nr:hypothetical protein [Argonema antarcticum A004/B2]
MMTTDKADITGHGYDIMSGFIGSVSVMREIVCGNRGLNFYHRCRRFAFP